MTPANILVVDDEENVRFTLSEVMQKEGYRVSAAASGEEAVKRAAGEYFDVAILDYNLGGNLNGLDTFGRLREENANLVGVLITAYGSKNLAIEAMGRGFFDYFTKPFDIREIRVIVHRAVERCQLQKEVQRLRASLEEQTPHLIGNGKAWREVMERVHRVAASDVSVLILGESGTGKELVAQALHGNSSRHGGPFVKVNCTAVPQELLEAEFFGFEKGAFTGAHKRKIGKFEQAHEGTLFLDEIGDMALATQAKILRVIQESEVERVGGNAPIKIDIRLITATNKDLKKAVATGAFREDLFYRLNVVSVQLPPLRERHEDIPLLVQHFLAVYAKKFKKSVFNIAPESVDLLLRYPWPGNIRELENVIQRGIILASGDCLRRQDLLDVYPPLGERLDGRGAPADAIPERLENGGASAREAGLAAEDAARGGVNLRGRVDDTASATEKRLILEALRQENWSRQNTADRLGISRKTLHNKMKRYGISK